VDFVGTHCSTGGEGDVAKQFPDRDIMIAENMESREEGNAETNAIPRIDMLQSKNICCTGSSGFVGQWLEKHFRHPRDPRVPHLVPFCWCPHSLHAMRYFHIMVLILVFSRHQTRLHLMNGCMNLR